MRGEPPRPVPKPPKAQKRNARNRGKYAEKRVADGLGGRLTLSSGRTALEKGDVRALEGTLTPLFVEVKYVGERVGKAEGSLTFPWMWMEKTLLDAQAAGCLPLVALRFGGSGKTLYVAPGEVFEHLISALKEAYLP